MTPRNDFNWDDVHNVPERRFRMMGVLIAMICLVAGAAFLLQDPDLRDRLVDSSDREPSMTEVTEPVPAPVRAGTLSEVAQPTPQRSRQEIRAEFEALNFQ